MNPPFLLAQLSDPHIGADWGVAGADPVAGLTAVVAAMGAVRPQPDAVLVSGDLVEHATDQEYEQVHELLELLQAPLYVLPGNHDDRRTLRHHFGLPGSEGEPVQYSVDLGPLRLVVLDTTRPGEDPGSLDADRLDWLDAELARAPEVPTLVAMHHPPLRTGNPVWDALGLAAADRHALGEVIARYGQVRRLVGGHVHRPIAAELAGRPVLSVPSTYLQGSPDFCSDTIVVSAGPAGFALHAVTDSEVISYLQPVPLPGGDLSAPAAAW
jgi:3',5'-cyclic-AMP phosphodiesterase